MIELLIKFLLSIAMIVFFYYYVKLYLFYISAKIAVYFKLTQYYSMEVAKGAVELPLVVLFHLGFSMVLLVLLHISINTSAWTLNKVTIEILSGIFLGIGMMAFSSLLCRAVMEVLRYMPLLSFPSEIKDWLIMARSGWLRHYLHTIEVLPFALALSIIAGQICCEEIIFRGVLIHLFSPEGYWVAVISSTILFMLMQLFHMPSLVSGIFPLIGSMVIGLVNGILYLKFSDIFPLIIAHFSFFVAAVL